MVDLVTVESFPLFLSFSEDFLVDVFVATLFFAPLFKEDGETLYLSEHLLWRL